MTHRTTEAAGALDSPPGPVGRALAALVRAASPWHHWLVSASLSLIARLGEWIPRSIGDGDAPGEGAYYVNPAVPALARVSSGVQLPPDRWIRVAGQEVPAWEAQRIARRLFPALTDATLYLFTLHTRHDLEDLERCFAAGRPYPR